MHHLLDKNIKSNFVDIGTGLRVHYLECNYTNKKDAPVALLLHGFPEISFSWRKIFPLLSKEGFRVIAICLLYTSPSPRDVEESRMPSSA